MKMWIAGFVTGFGFGALISFLVINLILSL